MNYTFNVFWVEDNTSWYGMERTKIESIVGEHCLQCRITRVRNSEFDVSQIKNERYDLMLIDYDLATKKTGVDAIKTIRDANVLTDILFYSSQYRSMIAAAMEIVPPLDGVYYSDRKMEEFHSKLAQVVSKVVQRSEDLINLRGFVLENTSDFELRIREILTISWGKFNSVQRDRLEEKMTQVLDEKSCRTCGRIEHTKKESCLYTAANNDDYLLGVGDRLDILQTILSVLIEDYNMPTQTCFSNIKKCYVDKVGKYRNRLGHVKLGENILHIDGKDICIDQELHRMLRTNITDIEKVISSIEKYLMINV